MATACPVTLPAPIPLLLLLRPLLVVLVVVGGWLRVLLYLLPLPSRVGDPASSHSTSARPQL